MFFRRNLASQKMKKRLNQILMKKFLFLFCNKKNIEKKSKYLEHMVQKILKLDEDKRSKLEKLLDKINEGSLELDSLLNFDFSPKKNLLPSMPKIQIIENYDLSKQFQTDNILIIKPLSSWNNGNTIGLRQIYLYDDSKKLIPLTINQIKINDQPPPENMLDLFNNCNFSQDSLNIWCHPLPPLPLALEIKIIFSKKWEIGGIKIWNLNKNMFGTSKGVKDCEIYYNEILFWKGIIKQGIENENLSEDIKFLNNFKFPNEEINKKSFINKNNYDSEPNLGKRNLEIEIIKEKIFKEQNICSSENEAKKKFEPYSSQISTTRSIKSHPKTPMIFQNPRSKLFNSKEKETTPKKEEQISEIDDVFKEPASNQMKNRWENNKEFLDNYNSKPKFFERNSEETAKKQQESVFNPLDTLKEFNLNNEARLIKDSVSKNLLTDFNKDIEELDAFFLQPSEKHNKEFKVIIPKLPCGRRLSISIYTTWGDPYYVGLSGIEIFDFKGLPITFKRKNQINATPADINVLPEYGHDPRTIDKLIDGTYRTCDDLHVWLAPFTKGKENLIEIDFLENITISMIRIWNYNKSRIHSFRGAKDIKINLDSTTIFRGQIKKAPGNLKNSEKFCEYIMFTEDEKTINNIEQNDWLNKELINLPLEEEIDNILQLYERPKTATKFFDEKELEEIQTILKISEPSQDLIGTDGRPLTIALYNPNNKTKDFKSTDNNLSNFLEKQSIGERKFVTFILFYFFLSSFR